jgi:hypothetical protein
MVSILEGLHRRNVANSRFQTKKPRQNLRREFREERALSPLVPVLIIGRRVHTNRPAN